MQLKRHADETDEWPTYENIYFVYFYTALGLKFQF
jgi:hypothetical protein